MKNSPYPVPPEPSLFRVIRAVLEAVRGDEALDVALDAYTKHDADNVRARFLSKRRAYEVTVLFDAESLAVKWMEAP